MPCGPSPPLSPGLRLPLVASYWILSVPPGQPWASAVLRAALLLAGPGTWTRSRWQRAAVSCARSHLVWTGRHQGRGRSWVTACDLLRQVRAGWPAGVAHTAPPPPC